MAWSKEARQSAANVQKEKRRNIHHDNVTNLPHMLQFLRWKSEIGYKVNDLEGRIPNKKFVKKTNLTLDNITLKILDKLFYDAVSYINIKPELHDEVKNIENIQTVGKYGMDVLKQSWPIPKTEESRNTPDKKICESNPEYEKDRKAVSNMKSKRFDDHNGNKLPFGIRPILKRPDLGYAVTRHPLLRDTEFEHYDLEQALANSTYYVNNYNKANFRKEPLIRFTELYESMDITPQMLSDYIDYTSYKFLTR